MIVNHHITIPEEKLAEICRRYHVRELALFGSILRDDYRDDSDIDVLVEFEPDAPIGLFEYAGLKHDLEDLLQRKIDLVEKAGLKPFIRDRILNSAREVYASVER